MIGNYIKAVAAAVSRSTAQLMKTGQTTSYRTGDDGDLERGRNVNFTTLAENNVFGNTNRFTDELGGQTYTKNIVIDWSTYNGSTVLGYSRTNTGSFSTWNQAIDGSNAWSFVGFTTGWRLPNVNELNNIANRSLATALNYPPFNISTFNIWSSNTQPDNTNAAFYIAAGSTGGIITTTSKTTSTSFIYYPVRTFTVTGTTLS